MINLSGRLRYRGLDLSYIVRCNKIHSILVATKMNARQNHKGLGPSVGANFPFT